MHCKGKQAGARSVAAGSSDPLHSGAGHRLTSYGTSYGPQCHAVLMGAHGQLERCRDTVPQYYRCVNSANAPPSLKEGAGAVLCLYPPPQTGLGQYSCPGERQQRFFPTCPDTERRGCQGALVGCAPGMGTRPHPCPLSSSASWTSAPHVTLLTLLPGHVPGLSETEGHKSHTNSEVFIFSKRPTSSLLKLVPGNLPKGPRTQQILKFTVSHFSRRLAVVAKARQ